MTNLFTPFRLVLLAIMAAAAVVGFIVIPADATLPVHWGPDGAPDGFASRDMALLWPLGVTAIVWGLFVLIGGFAAAGTVERGKHLNAAVLTGLTGILAAITVVTVLIGAGVEISMVRAIGFAMAVLLLLMGNALPKSQPNGIAGIRIPTTLGDPANWQATHRFTGWLCMAAGLVLLVAAATIPVTALIWVLIACVAGPMLAGTLYSIAHSKRHARS